MKKDKKNLYFVAIVTLVALGVFGVSLVRAFWYSPESEVEVLPSSLVAEKTTLKSDSNENPLKAEISQKKQIVPAGHPVRLSIPALDINAKVQKVGVNKKGNMAAPTNFKDVGWYKYGTVPGGIGSAVMAGHVDNGLAFAGVFKRLGELEKGDDVYVETDEGKRIHFVVTSREVYDFDAYVPEVFTEKDGRYLKLITCTGTWIESNRTHNKRLVVTAEMST